LQLGGRYARTDDNLNNESNNDAVFVSEQGVTYRFNNSLSTYFRRAENYRFPKADEQNGSLMDETPQFLNTQTGVSYELGTKAYYQQYEWQANLYQLDLNNEIAYAPIAPDEISASNRNLDPTRRVGAELSGQWHCAHDFDVGAGVSWVEPTFSSGAFSGNEIPYVANWVSKVFVSKVIQKHWTLYVESIYTGSRYASEDDANVGGKLGGYTIYNMNVAFHYDKMRLSMRLNNVTNKLYYSYVLMPSDSFYYYPAPERNVVFQVSYDFA
jgi:outer membrane receptor protein involved in Fe transport